MKKIKLLSLLIFATTIAHSQTWQWATSMGGAEFEEVGNVCIDSLDNLYLTVGFSHNAIIGTDTLLSQSTRSSFIAKVSSGGAIVWAKKAEGYEVTNGFTPGTGIFYEPYDGTILAASRMSGLNQAIGDCALSSNGQMGEVEHYLTKLDSDGSCQWSLKLNYISIRKLASDGAGSIYCLMLSPPWGATLQGNSLESGYYLVKLRTLDGSYQWAKKVVNDPVFATDLKYSNGELWLDGYTGGGNSFTLDSFVFNANPGEVFVSKFDTSATLQWARTLGDTPTGYQNYLGVDDSGNSYVAGIYDAETQIGDTSLTSSNGRDVFLVKYDNAGERVWVRTSFATASLEYESLFTDRFGSSVVTGKFTGTVTFGTFSITAPIFGAGFVAKYNSSGICVGARSIRNTMGGQLISTIDSDGNTIVAGTFRGDANFDGIVLTAVNGGDDAFVAKIDLTTSIPEYRIDGSNELFIYANPNLGKCTIDVPDDFLYENNLVLRIFDTSGKLIRQTPLVMNEGRIQLSLEQEAKGIYTATLSNNEKSYHGRIVFE